MDSHQLFLPKALAVTTASGFGGAHFTKDGHRCSSAGASFLINMKMTFLSSRFLIALLALCAAAASAQVAPAASAPLAKVEGAWVRSAVPGQQGTGAFMKLTAKAAVQLVGVSTPVAGTAELHEMKMDGDLMTMRPIAKLDLPAGRTVELKSGGYHLMLMDLKQPLLAGTTVPLTLVLRDSKGMPHKLELTVPVATRAPGAAAASTGHRH